MLARFALRRAVIGVLQVLVLLVGVFGLALLLPGDAADVQPTDQTSAAQRQETREVLGLDASPVTRFVRYIGHAATGDLGTSYTQGRPVTEVIGRPLLVSASMALAVTLLLVPVALGGGFLAGLRPGTWLDRAITTVSITLDSIPDFVLAVGLVFVLAISWGVLPATFVGVGAGEVLRDPRFLVLPLALMVARVAAPLVRLVRAGVIDQAHAPYVEQARRLGVPRRSLLLRHVGPNALAPAMQDLGRTGDSLISGVLVVEAVFVMPGVLTTLLDAIGNRDQPVVLGIVLVTGLVAIAVNALIDLAGQRMVPRRLRA